MIFGVVDALQADRGSDEPGRRGNDLARVFVLPADSAEACRVIRDGSRGRWTAARSTGRVFVGIASCGFDSDAERIANEASPRLGNVVYAYGALRVLVSW